MTMPAWAIHDPDQDVWTLQIHVQPGARASSVAGVHDGRLKLKIAAQAVDNKANESLIGFLSGLFGVGVRQVCIVRGENARQKTVAVRGAGSGLPDLLQQEQ